MDPGWVDNILYFIGIVPALALMFFVIEVNKLLGIRIQQSKIQLKKHSDLPEYINQLYSDAVEQLTPLGFKVQHCQVSQDVVANAVTHKWSLVLLQAENGVYAEISPASSCLDMPGYEVSFWSFAPDGNTLLTINGRGHTVLSEIPGVTIHDPMVLSLHQQYDTHIEERREWSSSITYQQPDPVEYVKVQQKLMDGYLSNLSQQRDIVAKDNNQFRLSLVKCLKIVFRYFRGERRARKLLKTRFKLKLKNKLTGTATKALASAQYPVESDIAAYMRLNSTKVRHPSGLFTKSLLVIATLLVMYAFLKLPYSYNSILILLGVILLHELGHILTMLVFRYRDSQVLCVSLLGTATMSINRPIANWKQVIIYLMGPLPGIAAGIALIILNQDVQLPWLYETAIMLLMINYLHLLPFMSLDGGRIMRLTIMERSPIGKLLFPTLSAVAFAAGGHFLGEPVFWILAMIIFASIPFGIRESIILSRVYKQINRDQNIKDFHSLDWYNKLGQIFIALKNPKFRKLNYVKKFDLARSLTGIISQPKHSNSFASFVFLSIYLSALVATPSVLFINDLVTQRSSDGKSLHLGKVAKNDLEAQIMNAESAQKQFELLINAATSALNNNDLKGMLKYLERAESTYGNINTDDALATLFERYSQYHLRKNELSDAQQYLKKTISLYKKTPKYYALQLATSYQEMSEIKFKQNNNAESEYNLQKALSYAIQVEEPDDWHIITDLSGQLLDWYYLEERQNDIQKLLNTLTAKFSTRDEPIKNYVTKFIYEELGWMHAEDNDEKAALEKFDQALALAEHNNELLKDQPPNRNEETKLLLYKAAVYHKEGYDDFSRIQIRSAESLAKENSFKSLEQYIKKYSPQSIAVDTRKKQHRRDEERWKLISDAYHKTNS